MAHARNHTKLRQVARTISGAPLKLSLATIALTASGSIWAEEMKLIELTEMLALTVLLYGLIHLQCGLRDRLRPADDAVLLVNNFKSEIKFALGLLAYAFIVETPLSKAALITFLGFNTALQNIPVILRQWIGCATARRLGVGNSSFHILHPAKDSGLAERRALVYGAGDNGKRVVETLAENPQSDITPVGFIDCHRKGLWSYRDVPLIGGLEKFERTVLESQVDVLFMAAEPEDLQGSQRVFELAEKMGVPVCVLPHVYHTQIGACHLEHFNGQPALVYSSSRPKSPATLLKETVDRVAAAVGILVISPLLALTAIAVKVTSRGPAFFSQTRLGQNGAPFQVYKFRTMSLDAEDKKKKLQSHNEMSGPMFKMKNDPRTTPLGRILRKYSVDELPQLFNVLKGDMSLVGPRPALPKEVAEFAPWQRRKLAVKPGLTCIWQVSGRNNIDFEDWMKLDLEYIDNWSLWLDAKIIARTAPTVLKGTGC
jgi:exopolysaccharide biosynthesis polyprenyl glycosylphosphotransferase